MNQPKHPPATATAPAPKPKEIPAHHQEDALDVALEESFPASDPIAVSVTRDSPPKR